MPREFVHQYNFYVLFIIFVMYIEDSVMEFELVL